MSSSLYVIQIKLKGEDWSRAKNVIAASDEEATEQGQMFADKEKRLGQNVVGFRVMKVTIGSARLICEVVI